MSDWTWPVVAGAQIEVAPRVRVARFGDGYEQRVADGINAMPRRISVLLRERRQIVQAADAFLRAHAGVQTFTWTPPDGGAGQWVCRTWSISYPAGDVAELSATFEEVFG